MHRFVPSSLVLLALAAVAHAQQPPSEYKPEIAGASDEAQRAIAAFTPAEGLRVELYAAEPLVANPVVFCFDEQGRCYVAETFRQQRGVEDNRGHMVWLDDDIACRTVEDRLAMFKKHLGDKVQEYAVHHDRIRRLVDTDGDGRPDEATVFADGFNDILDGTGAGVLARGGDVYYACIPKLWLLRDENGDGRADERRALHHGYGVHVAFRGHDMHGFVFGPDGKLYFSIGDRGFNVQTEGRTVARPDTGAVLRCNPDGSELEVFAWGLRNPQELAFDEWGNLFTGDNNSDSGDQARWVHVVEGGNSGWLMSYQYFSDRGPWNREKLWHPQHEGQAAYIVPPLANLADGPSGLAYYPGTGLPEKYARTFFLCDFRGNSVNSGVRTIRVKPRGASFEVSEQGQFVWQLLATDVAFGPRGGLYVSDWVNGWNGIGKGRIYRVFDPDEEVERAASATAEIIAQGMAGRERDELLELLAHADMRVRQEAQFALAARDEPETLRALYGVVKDSQHRLAQVHAIWAIGQLGRGNPKHLAGLKEVLNDDDSELRAQAARVLGDARYAPAGEKLIAMLGDDSPRPRYFAAQGLGKLYRPDAIGPLLALLRENADADPFLRHAAVMGLAGCGDADALLEAAGDPAKSARLGVLLALRRIKDARVARYLSDPEPALIAEAARAVYDVPIEAGLPELAALVSRPGLPDPAVRRALNAVYRLGTAEQAAAVARLAADADASNAMRIEAMQLLAAWAEPAPRDRVLGLHRPLSQRPAEIAVNAARGALSGMFAGPDEVRQEAARLAGTLRLGDAGPMLAEMAVDGAAPAKARIDALAALANMRDAGLRGAIDTTLKDDNPAVRAAALTQLARLDRDAAVPVVKDVLARGTTIEKQQALLTLRTMRASPEADAILVAWLDKLLAGELPPELHLDLLTAAERKRSPDVRSRLERFEASRSADDPLAAYRETLHGGDAEHGAEIFFDRVNASCRRCHKVQDKGGGIGPELTHVAREKNREYLLEAIVAPNRTIAKNFESVILALDDGRLAAGILKREDDKQIELQTPEGNFITVDKQMVVERARGKSAMPEDLLKLLSKSDVRDLVEFLSTLK